MKDLLHYDPFTGVFTWAIKPSAKVAQGSIAGKIRRDGCRVIRVEGRDRYAHRLAFLLMTGEMPALVDYVDGDRSNNRFSNLRAATPSLSNGNTRRRSDNLSGYKGVTFHQTKRRWQARIKLAGRQKSLGYFRTAAEAHAAYKTAASLLFGEFARVE